MNIFIMLIRKVNEDQLLQCQFIKDFYIDEDDGLLN